MGHAKRRDVLETAADTQVEQDIPLDDRSVDALLGGHEGNDDTNLVTGLRYAMVAGTALWAVIGLIVFLLL